MSYVLTQFDGVILPVYKQRDMADVATSGPASSSLRRLSNGRYVDTQGTERNPLTADVVSRACEIFGTDWADVRGQLDILEAKKGVRGALTKAYRDGVLRWQYAKLLHVEAPASLRTWNSQTTILTFQTEQPEWRGASHAEGWSVGDDSFYIGDGTASLGVDTTTVLTATGATTQAATLTNGGKIDAKELIVTVTAGTNTITAITWANATSGYGWTWTGSLTTGQVLIVDTDAVNVTKQGANAYATFTPTDLAVWDRIVSGDNEIAITVTGNAAADGVISWTYWDMFA